MRLPIGEAEGVEQSSKLGLERLRHRVSKTVVDKVRATAIVMVVRTKAGALHCLIWLFRTASHQDQRWARSSGQGGDAERRSPVRNPKRLSRPNFERA